MKRRKKRCWKGYKPVKGKRPYSKGSCRKIRKNAKKLTADERWHLLKQSRDRYVKRAMIPLRTAKAMVRAGLPVRRSELRGNPLADLQILTQITEALKNLKKRNYNDEMIESVTMRRRPGHPTDYIIAVKHRYFVNGSRVYSAGLKTEETIEKFVRVIGRKTKRVGNSDYVFNIYGVRFPEAIKKKKPGKLFDNPKSFPNIEKSGFHKGEYVGYSPKAVNVFYITKSSLVGWRAMGEIYKTNPPRKVWKILYAKNLAEMSKLLENL
jgi:hypothetical protein